MVINFLFHLFFAVVSLFSSFTPLSLCTTFFFLSPVPFSCNLPYPSLAICSAPSKRFSLICTCMLRFVSLSRLRSRFIGSESSLITSPC
uniref:Putative secreted peptide n=1 Tax=Anopheles braziliensis TaxID=58242 RepID=A0A2M3ZPD5_9DIPT